MKTLYKTPIALAVAALFVSPMALAGQNSRDRDKEGVKISKELSIEKDVEYKGDVHVGGLILVDGNAEAVIKDEQINIGNGPVEMGPPQEPTLVEGLVINHPQGPSNGDLTVNKATASDNVLQNASGNIGLNITAGDSNQQANAAALAVADANFVLGSSADSTISAKQLNADNFTPNVGKTNLARLNGNVLQNATGNIGVNVSAGNNNQQKNDLAASVSVSRMADAGLTVEQGNFHNQTSNSPFNDLKWSLSGGSADIALSGGYAGSSSNGSYTGSASGSSTGVSDQIGNVYPDIWLDGSPGFDSTTGRSVVHNQPGNTYFAHSDFDTQTDARDTSGNMLPQSVTDPSGDGGVLAFNNNDTYSGTEGGTLAFNEAGDIRLSGSATWNSFSVETMWVPTTNTANLSGNALQGASGNIGVNIAAGTNNQQYNGLSIAASFGNGSTTPPNGGGE